MAERFINAAKDGYLDLLRKATKRDLNTGDEDGMTATMWAAHNGHLDALKLICGREGDVNKFDYLGMTALHHAARKGNLPIVTFLVNWGANIFALDNDNHSALNLASLYDKVDVTQYLDGVTEAQKSKNRKTANKRMEDAVKQAEQNRKRYEKMQEEAARQAEKQHRKLSNSYGALNGAPGGQSAGQRKQNFIKTLTMRMRGGPKKLKAPTGRNYSDMAGMSHTTGARGAVAKRINQRKFGSGSENGTNGVGGMGDDFKVSAMDESGRRTLRSLGPAAGVRSYSSEVMYLTAQRGEGSPADISTSRPAVYEVFPGSGRPSLFKAKSESDLLDSGTDSYFGDEDDDEENAPGIFNRPGFGKTVFMTGNFLNTLPSFDAGAGGEDGAGAGKGGMVNGLSHASDRLNGEDHPDGLRNGSVDGAVEDADPGFHGPKELPWDMEEVDTLDDDDDMGDSSSPLEVFLWSAGLETYLHRFLQEKIDMDLLLGLSDKDLREIGLPFGPRKRLLEAIKRRQDVLAQPKVQMTDSFL